MNRIAEIGKRIIVISGGSVAIDAARVAMRLGAGGVKLFCLESREEMLSHDWEIREVVAEGAEPNPSWGPKRIWAKAGRPGSSSFTASRCSTKREVQPPIRRKDRADG
jgi:NADPH-dependent glutamate synthase beta subunit-like oxidoreductase